MASSLLLLCLPCYNATRLGGVLRCAIESEGMGQLVQKKEGAHYCTCHRPPPQTLPMAPQLAPQMAQHPAPPFTPPAAPRLGRSRGQRREGGEKEREERAGGAPLGALPERMHARTHGTARHGTVRTSARRALPAAAGTAAAAAAPRGAPSAAIHKVGEAHILLPGAAAAVHHLNANAAPPQAGGHVLLELGGVLAHLLGSACTGWARGACACVGVRAW
jgi:hypothetical protein